jgi:hypothetical protein
MSETWPPLTYPRLSWALAPRWGGRSAYAGGFKGRPQRAGENVVLKLEAR